MCNLKTIKGGAVNYYCSTHSLLTDSLVCPLSGYKQASALDLLTLGERKLVVVDGQIVRVVTDEAREETRHGYRSYQTKTYTKIYVPVGELTTSEISEVVWWKVEEVAAISDCGEV